MSSSIEINFSGYSNRLLPLNKISKELSSHYKVRFTKHTPPEHFDWHYDHGPDITDLLVVTITVARPFLKAMREYLVHAGFKMVLRKFVFEPFLSWLDKHKAVAVPDELLFIYDDIQIRLAYSQGNHINTVSQLFLALANALPQIDSLGLGDLKVIASPVYMDNNKWFYGLPSENPRLRDYLNYWGLQFNHHRCIYFLSSHQVIYEVWEE
jgi:hypothetical protein